MKCVNTEKDSVIEGTLKQHWECAALLTAVNDRVRYESQAGWKKDIPSALSIKNVKPKPAKRVGIHGRVTETSSE